jgi:hypothetical protein
MKKAKAVAAKNIGVEQHGGLPLHRGEDNHALATVEVGKDIIVVGLSTFEGKAALDVRKYFLTPNKEWFPTKQGIRIPAEAAGEVLDAIIAQRDMVMQLLGQ